MQTKADIEKLFIPSEFRDSFEFVELVEKKREWNLILREIKDLIPPEIQGQDAVLNGYMNFVEIVNFPFYGKLMYIKFIRRRWKIRGENKSYFNQYEFHPVGMKATKEFGAFLKDLDREELAEFFSAWKDIRLIRQEDI
jgi:hypothetical protein